MSMRGCQSEHVLAVALWTGAGAEAGTGTRRLRLPFLLVTACDDAGDSNIKNLLQSLGHLRLTL